MSVDTTELESREISVNATSDQIPQPDHVALFCSYARQDADIIQAFLRGFTRLNETMNHNIYAFHDKAIEPGQDFDNVIREKLQDADYLLVFYTGVRKPSHSYTGFEIGYFQSVIDQQEEGGFRKQIISFYLNEPPGPTAQIQGIDLRIAAQDLSMTRARYMSKCREQATAAQPDALTQFFISVAELAQKRRPFRSDEGDIAKVNRIRQIQEKILPDLRGDLYDCQSSRVARASVEQRAISFELPGPATAREAMAFIPEEATLTAEGGAFELFGVKPADNDGQLKWREFKRELESRGEIASPALYAIERALVTVVSSQQGDNDQIIKAPRDNSLYRVIVTEQQEYYDGRLVVRMWFIRFLNRALYGNKDTSILLSFISVASKYRFLFLEEESPLSIERFRAESDPKRFQEKVRRLLREVVLIEEESRVFDLDKATALLVIAGAEGADFVEDRKNLDAYATSRAAMVPAASGIVNLAPEDPTFQSTRDAWISTLEKFLDSSRRINSVYTAKALVQLRNYFVDS